MYLISYNNKNYFIMRQYNSRTEAEEALEYDTINLIYFYCFNHKPQSVILKNSQLKEFFDQNKSILSILPDDVTLDNILNGLYNSLQITPKEISDFIKLRRYYHNTPLENNGEELAKLVLSGEADKIPWRFRVFFVF